jgi:hypothetical protein
MLKEEISTPFDLSSMLALESKPEQQFQYLEKMDTTTETNSLVAVSSSPITSLSAAFSSVSVVTSRPARRCLARDLEQEMEYSIQNARIDGKNLSNSCPNLPELQVPQSAFESSLEATQANIKINNENFSSSPRYMRHRLQRHSVYSKIKIQTLARRPRPVLHSKSMEIEIPSHSSSTSTLNEIQQLKMQPNPQANSVLPCIHGSHADLKCISADTVINLILYSFLSRLDFVFISCLLFSKIVFFPPCAKFFLFQSLLKILFLFHCLIFR